MKQTIRYAALSILKPYKHNPAIRSDVRSQDFFSLQKAVKDYDLQRPLVLSKTGWTIVDGNRRFLVMKRLNWKEAPYIRTSIADIDEAFKVLNTQLPLTPAQQLTTYLSTGRKKPISDRVAMAIDSIINLVGKDCLHVIASKKASPYTYSAGLAQYVTYTSCRDQRELRRVFFWMAGVGSAQNLKLAIGDKIDRDLLRTAIMEEKSLKRSWDME